VLAAPAAGDDVTRDLGAQFPGFRSALVLRDVGPGASGRVCRPMAEKALAALGVLPAR
jgi:hypothetical protein